MLVTTLPITPGKHNSFVTLFGPLIAGIFSEITDSQFKMILNTTNSFRSYHSFVEVYVRQLGRLNLNPSIECDDEEKYQKNLIKVLLDLEEKGFLAIEEINMVYCDCGIVELPLEAFRALKKQNRGKNISQDDKCTGCGTFLKTGREETLILKFSETLSRASIYPPLYQKRFQQLYKQLSERPLVISRNHRRDGLKIKLSGRFFNLDTDFCWMTYLTYLKGNSLCVISGTDTLRHLASAVKLLDIYKLGVKVNIITHPLLNPFGVIKDKTFNYTIDGYLDFCEIPQVARTFLMTGARWNKPEVRLNLSDLFLTKKSVHPCQKFIMTEGNTVVTPENFQRIFNSNKILSLLKVMRGVQVKLSADQMKIKKALLI